MDPPSSMSLSTTRHRGPEHMPSAGRTGGWTDGSAFPRPFCARWPFGGGSGGVGHGFPLTRRTDDRRERGDPRWPGRQADGQGQGGGGQPGGQPGPRRGRRAPTGPRRRGPPRSSTRGRGHQAADEARVDAELQATAIDQAQAEVALDEAERLDEIERQQGADHARTRTAARSRREELDRQVAADQAALDHRDRGVEAGAAAAEARAQEIDRHAASDAQAAATLAAARETVEEDGR
jgi:hypothetical protein